VTVLLGILGASLLGSVHCAAMCGAFVCGYAGQRRDVAVGAMAHAAYNGGRLLSYLVLGAAAGAAGAGLDRAGALAGVSRGAAVAAGALMVLWAAATLGRHAGVRVPLPDSQWASRPLGALLLRARDASPEVRAGLLGLLTTLLPCGWLYVFVVAAGATGSPLTGAATMGMFWLGTLPVMLIVGLGARRIAGPLATRLPALGAGVVLVLGLLTIAGRVRVPVSGADHAAASNVHERH
jgi:uncharacterized protein